MQIKRLPSIRREDSLRPNREAKWADVWSWEPVRKSAAVLIAPAIEAVFVK